MPLGPRRRIWLAVTAAVFLLATGCAEKAPQDALAPHGSYARRIDHLWNFVLVPATAIFVLVLGLVVVTVVRHRHRPGRPEPVQVHGNTKLEITWTVVPALLLLGVAIPTISTIFDLARDPKGPQVLRVDVAGHLWWWEYRYPSLGVVTANELHIPTGRTVRLSLRSRETGFGPDVTGVIHSYWVPGLAGKQDVVPGRTNHITLEADEPGYYPGQCAEFCGLSHANMRLAVVAQTPAEFDEWVADQKRPAATPTSGAAARGLNVFTTKGCNGCHTIGGVAQAAGIQGPNLTHLKSRAKFAGYIFDNTPENLKKWVHDPPAMKPMHPDRGLGMPNLGLKPQEVDDVVAYLETLR